uniref:Uncharacterized protein n=1 Tax=Rhizophora mucronata TaxID=61149 RepID=A0A2P2J4C2_RHIMU
MNHEADKCVGALSYMVILELCSGAG